MPSPCYDIAGNEVPCSTEQMGEQYYTAVQSGDASQLNDWWNQHLSFFMEGNEDIDINNPEVYNQWMGTYGQYFAPLSFDERDYNRILREKRLKSNKLKLEFLEGSPKAEITQGKRGFSGAGGTAKATNTMWDTYASGLQGIQTSTQEDLQDLYGSFGDNFLQLNIALAGMGAFTDPEYSQEVGFSYEDPICEEGDEECFDNWLVDNEQAFQEEGANPYEFEEFGSYQECLESCYESEGDYTGCAQSCLD